MIAAPIMHRRGASAALPVLLLIGFASALTATAASVLSLGPRSAQSLIAGQLFNRAGRWFLIDDGACFTYLDSPRVRLESDRLVLNAHLSSRLGQRIGDTCAGADFASNITLSGRLRSSERTVVLDDIRIDRVEDESTRNALSLALQLAPQAMPRQASIDLAELLRQQAAPAGKTAVHIDQLRIVSVVTRTDAVVVQFDASLSAP